MPLIAIAVLLALVICPCALIAIVGTLEAVPYEAFATPVLVMLKVVPVSVNPVPAEYTCELLNSAKVIGVVVKLIVPTVVTI